jgi:hypothetical protein
VEAECKDGLVPDGGVFGRRGTPGAGQRSC